MTAINITNATRLRLGAWNDQSVFGLGALHKRETRNRLGMDNTIKSSATTPLLDDNDIYDDLYSAIIGQKISPGSKLKEETLSEIYGASRSRIRKILSRLSHDRVVTLIANRGAFVSKPSLEEALEVFAARRVIEGYLVRLLADRNDPGTCRLLREHLKVEKIARRSQRFEAVVRCGGDFHLVLAKAAKRPIVGNFVRELVARSALISATYEIGVPSSCEHEEHERLTDCIEKGDADEAVAIMEQHLTGIESRLNLAAPKAFGMDLRDVLAPATRQDGQAPGGRTRGA